MEHKIYTGIAALLIVVMAACTQREQDAGGAGTAATTADTASTSAAVPPAAAPVLAPSALDSAQGEALAFLVAINEQHVAAAEQARGKKIDARVRAFADLLHDAQSQNLEQSHAVAAGAGLIIKDSAEVSTLRSKGQADLERMAALDEDDYADAYLEAMANGHAGALALIDGRLLPAASNQAVRQHLTATRTQMAQHLRAARELQGQSQ